MEACTLHQQVMQLLAPSACLFSLCCLFVAAPAERFLFLGLTRKLCHLPIWRSVCFCAPVVQTSIQIDGEKPRGSFCSIAPSRNTYALWIVSASVTQALTRISVSSHAAIYQPYAHVVPTSAPGPHSIIFGDAVCCHFCILCFWKRSILCFYSEPFKMAFNNCLCCVGVT